MFLFWANPVSGNLKDHKNIPQLVLGTNDTQNFEMYLSILDEIDLILALMLFLTYFKIV